MQDDASKEVNDANTAIICLPTKEQTKISLGKTNGQRPTQRLQRDEIRSGNTPIVSPMKSDHDFADLQNQLHEVNRQSIEGVNRWKDNKQILMMTMVSFCK
jgi:hypothetical protein